MPGSTSRPLRLSSCGYDNETRYMREPGDPPPRIVVRPSSGSVFLVERIIPERKASLYLIISNDEKSGLSPRAETSYRHACRAGEDSSGKDIHPYQPKVICNRTPKQRTDKPH